MKNCHNCIHKELLGNLVGCKQRKQIMVFPNLEKDCCEDRLPHSGFMKLFESFIKEKPK